MGTKNIIIFLSSVRPGRMADRVGIFVKRTVEAEGMKAIIFDPLLMNFELVREPIHFLPDPSLAPDWMKHAHEQLKAADGFIITSTEYNCSIPPALTNMMAHFPPISYSHRPCGLIGYSIGPFGGIRALTLLRTYAAEFGMLPVPTNVPIPTVQHSFDENGICTEPLVSNNILKLVKQVSWYADAIKKHAAVHSVPH